MPFHELEVLLCWSLFLLSVGTYGFVARAKERMQSGERQPILEEHRVLSAPTSKYKFESVWHSSSIAGVAYTSDALQLTNQASDWIRVPPWIQSPAMITGCSSVSEGLGNTPINLDQRFGLCF